jgi:ribonuclease Z
MNFKFTTLGCASALPTVNRYPSAHVLNIHERLFLIDCGEGCQMQMRRYGFSFMKIQNIFISHLHGDHLFGLWGLLSTMSLIGRNEDLFIYAPPGFKDIIKSILHFFGGSFMFKVIHVPLNTEEVTHIFETKSVDVYSFPLNHRVDCCGFLFKEKMPRRNVFKHLIEPYGLSLYEIARLKEGESVVRTDGEVLDPDNLTYQPYEPRSFAYCSDTAPFDMLTEYVRGCDLIYHEATFASDMKEMAARTMHSTASDAALTALEAGVGKLLLGHYSSRYKDINVLLDEAKQIFMNTFVTSEGLSFEVKLKRFRKR